MMADPLHGWLPGGVASLGAAVGGVLASGSDLVTLENLGAAALMFLALKATLDFVLKVLDRRRAGSQELNIIAPAELERARQEQRQRDEASKRREERLLEAQRRTAGALEEALASDRHQEQLLLGISNGISGLRDGIGCPLSSPDGRRSVARDFEDHRRAQTGVRGGGE